MKNLRIVFMGTPEFAVATLGSLLMNGFNVVGAVTVPDKPAGRGRSLQKSAVKEFAESSYIPVFQPNNLKDPEFIQNLKDLNADVFIVVAFRMLPEVVWKLPPLGTINLHASLLPYYRGAAPINHAVINGESRTGVTTFYIDDKIDTGNILMREEVHIFPFENAGDIHDRMTKLGARLVIKTLAGIVDKSIKPRPQSDFIIPGTEIRPAPKIHPEDCVINWNSGGMEIHNLIRGLAPAPGARSVLRNNKTSLTFKIFESIPEPEKHSLPPGTIVSDSKHFIRIACADGFLSIINLQLEGKKKMNSIEFLKGFRITDYIIDIS
ncbi:MAG TPA: methionyl-tRNA formyltransferase [Bacteroidales bacterium]|nr:methionyl-tRNA formyltransferase [Bacteroidales bacterium]HBH82666.1 methionyl-tRNA formyltransferase [Bacteroidales bacterium]HBQ82993.1 methionyl-tRNA formyltransferase [Bacteroidales bacterium]HCU20116.1 methionyl-tRNA formyltransferase [Bacteroidales bacterium]